MSDVSESLSVARRYRFLTRLGRLYTRFSSPVAFLARRFIADSAAMVSAHCPITLDVGCGSCPYAQAVRQAFHSDFYIGIDVAPTDNTILVADARMLPFADAAADLVVSFDAIQHFAESERTLDEIARVLRVDGYVLLTFPFLYAECDFHDFQRWTIEGMSDALTRRGLHPVSCKRRGGSLFACACGLTWMVQHLVPGQRRSWRSRRNWLDISRMAVIALMTLPTMALAWLALLTDRVLQTRGAYMGGAILARKTAVPSAVAAPSRMTRDGGK